MTVGHWTLADSESILPDGIFFLPLDTMFADELQEKT